LGTSRRIVGVYKMRMQAGVLLFFTFFACNLPSVASGINLSNKNLSSLAELTASDGAQQNDFGVSVAMSGNTIATVGGGKIYVFVKPISGWTSGTQTAELSASDGTYLYAVATDSNTIVARSLSRSALYVFVKSASGWVNTTETAILSSSDGALILGVTVSVSGKTIVAGSGGSQNGSGSSAAYVFVEPAGGWVDMTQTAELTPSDGGGPFFAVSVSGNAVVVGALGTTVGSNYAQGEGYVYVMPTNGWVDMAETARLTASDGMANDAFGAAVAISGTTIVVGASGAEITGHYEGGACYVFTKPASGWATTTQTAKLTASDARYKSEMGFSVSASANSVVCGAPQQPIEKNQIQGAAYAFAKPPTGWTNRTQTAQLTASDGNGGLATSFAASGGVTAVGAPYTTVGLNLTQGAVYVFGPAQNKNGPGRK
jgi:hypothetical protein